MTDLYLYIRLTNNSIWKHGNWRTMNDVCFFFSFFFSFSTKTRSKFWNLLWKKRVVDDYFPRPFFKSRFTACDRKTLHRGNLRVRSHNAYTATKRTHTHTFTRLYVCFVFSITDYYIDLSKKKKKSVKRSRLRYAHKSVRTFRTVHIIYTAVI